MLLHVDDDFPPCVCSSAGCGCRREHCKEGVLCLGEQQTLPKPSWNFGGNGTDGIGGGSVEPRGCEMRAVFELGEVTAIFFQPLL